MKKAWIYKRKNVKGWWVGWYESGKRKAKALPSKALAEHFRQMKYAQLNSDVFTGTVTVDWSQMREEYSQYKKVKGDKQSTLYETDLTLRHFERLIGINTKQGHYESEGFRQQGQREQIHERRHQAQAPQRRREACDILKHYSD